MTSPPRVLYLTSRFPFPPDRGDRVHAFYMIRAFARRFSVTVASYEDAAENLARGQEVFRGWGVRSITCPLPGAGRASRLVRAVLSARPLQVAYYEEPAMRRRLQELAHDQPPFDALVCHLIRPAPLASAVGSRVRVISLCDSLSLGLRRRLDFAPLLERPSIWLEARRVARFEAQVLASFDEGWVVSEVDRETFGDHAGKVRVIPNGVEESLFEGEVPDRTPPVVGFLGHLGVPHNVDAAATLVREIMPLIWAREPQARVRLIGPEPAPRLRGLAAHPNVELSGFAPDLRQALRELRVFCAPLRFSAGIQNKLIEAAAAGVPVVSSPQAIQALGDRAHEHMVAAVTPQEYADAILARWSFDAARAHSLGAAREWVRQEFRWDAFAERLEELVASGAQTRGAIPGGAAIRSASRIGR